MDICSYIAGSDPLEEPEDLEVLLEIAEAVRSFSDQGRREDIAGLIRYTIRFGYHEALYWILGILEEGAIGGFECPIDRTIPDYEEFIRRLGVDLRAFQNDVVQVRDENGEEIANIELPYGPSPWVVVGGTAYQDVDGGIDVEYLAQLIDPAVTAGFINE